ncbi:MAG: DUF502 domain-containing protein [Quinella sp. 2Q5]|nr:DUF502 domain-containing protein [Quinella sp. 2Q5]
MGSDNKPATFTERVSSSFLRGLLIVVPPAITVAVVTWLFDLTESSIGKILPVKVPGVGLLIVVVGIWAVGVLSGNFLSRKVIDIFDAIIGKIPVVKFIYGSVKQVTKALFETDSAFKNVVLVPYRGAYVLGFQMLSIPEPVRKKLGDDYVCVYMPWSMNMTAGMNFFVRKSDVIPVDMLPPDAFQFILTAGTISTAGLVSKDALKGAAK